MKHLDFTFDLETCATTANAAVMQVAAVAWDRHAHHNPFPVQQVDKLVCFNEHVDLRSCVVDGFDFDQATVQWWARQSSAAKDAVTGGLAEPIKEVFERFILWVQQVMKEAQAESVCLWCQGMDFDGAILRNVCNKYSIHIPFPFQQFRDCRSIIVETAIMCAEGGFTSREDGHEIYPSDILKNTRMAYGIYKPLPDEFGGNENAHDAMYDCLRSSWNTWQALRFIQNPESII